MKKYISIMTICILCISALIGTSFATESFEYIDDPTYYPQGLLAMYHGFSEDEYMSYVNELDESYRRVSNVSGDIKGYSIGRMASFCVDWNDENLSDRHLAKVLLDEVWDVDEETQTQIDNIKAILDSSRVWLMGTETYGWGLQYDIPALGEEFYLFRVDTGDQRISFIIACQYEVDGGESVSFRILEQK